MMGNLCFLVSCIKLANETAQKSKGLLVLPTMKSEEIRLKKQSQVWDYRNQVAGTLAQAWASTNQTTDMLAQAWDDTTNTQACLLKRGQTPPQSSAYLPKRGTIKNGELTCLK